MDGGERSRVEALMRASEAEFETLAEDLGRARRLVETFVGLGTQLEAQRDGLQRVSRELQGDHAQGGLFPRMNGMVQDFVRDIVAVSHGSLQLVEHVEALGVEIDSIGKRMTHVEALAAETRMVALSARIEGDRHGHRGNHFKLVADNVGTLARESGTFSKQTREAVERCAARLADARASAGTLASQDLSGALTAHELVLVSATQLDEANAEVFEKLSVTDIHLDTAVEALQFKDALSEELTRTETVLRLLGELCHATLTGAVEPAQRALTHELARRGTVH
jgi:hypothetical protein